MYAIIETGGKQYKVSEGSQLNVEKLEAAPGAEVVFDRVLAVVGDGEPVYGAPYVKKAAVKAEVVSVGKADKVMVFKQLPRKSSRKLRGHRQPFTKVKITAINMEGGK
jgi:large subunit ribosomal protein L21